MSDDSRPSSGSSRWSGPIGAMVVGALVAILAVGSVWYARQNVFGHESGGVLQMPSFEETPEGSTVMEARESSVVNVDMRAKQTR
ncbi:hypothetical protein ACXN5S_08520 [Pseudoroseicyclus sp. H15]